MFFSTESFKVKKLSPLATLPTRGSKWAAGYDLYSSKDMTIPARGKAMIPTDISISLPTGTYGRMAPRSGLAVKHHLDVGAGVVDCDYRGPLAVVMFNFSAVDYKVCVGDRIAQLVIERIAMLPVEEVDDLDDTNRGSDGFGSTGK